MDAVALESEALKLSEADRAVLVDHLQESLSSSRITHLEEHLADSHARFDAYKAGEVKAVEGQEFVSQLRSNLQKLGLLCWTR